MKRSTQQLYASRLEKVIIHLHQHLDADPDLYRLADIACLSPYHFHRVWRAWMGETVTETVRRLRLHRAAGELIASPKPLALVANRAGYESPAAFSRAFRQAYGLPPNSFRTAHASGHPTEEEPNMYNVTIEEIGPFTLASVPHTGSYMEISHAFERLMLWTQKQGVSLEGHRMFGIYYSDPQSVPVNELKSAAAMTLPAGVKADNGVEPLQIARERYATLEFIGPYAGLAAAYNWLYSEWLPKNGFLPGNAPATEEYLNNPRNTPPTELRTLIRIPLAS
ncbi:AraC family transcriptional regulator [Andreprevotia chitinilytica]|uniref:AraC family transcriptional regulator n=1 Tax=Andreprevotia chitinilytica TaxID=396808 RepID=UPI000557ABB9|nr:AraC family transcriptional regulator [Andreprevotia chitinilytica]